jgi:hypothetical protein
MSQALTELAARFHRIAGTDATDESIRAAEADGGRLILALVKQGRYTLSSDAKQAYRTVAPIKATDARAREYQLSWLWQLAAADAIPVDMIHPNDSTDNHVAAERNALAAELLAARVAAPEPAPEPAVVTIPPELQKLIDQLPEDKGLRPAYRRDHLYRLWNENEGLGPAAIRDRWNSLSVEVRRIISPRCFGEFQTGTTNQKSAARVRVGVALERAKREAPAKPNRKTKTPRRTKPKPKTCKV